MSGRVQRRQAERFADRDAQIVAGREQAYQQQAAAIPQQATPADRASAADPLEQLKALGELRAQGVLTDEEFAAQKAKILNA